MGKLDTEPVSDLAKCGSVTVISPHELIGSGTIRKYGLVGRGVAFLKEVCHHGKDFET